MVTAPQRHRAHYVLMALFPLLLGCGGGDGVPDDTGDTHTVSVFGAHTAFTLDVPEDWAFTFVTDNATCGSGSYQLGDRLAVVAVPTSCAQAAHNGQIGNGFHGLYRIVDDVVKPLDETTVTTPAGTATVFTQAYFECTNSCDNWDEPVAIVTLAQPFDPAYPTLVVRGDKNLVSRSELEKILGTLQVPAAGSS